MCVLWMGRTWGVHDWHVIRPFHPISIVVEIVRSLLVSMSIVTIFTMKMHNHVDKPQSKANYLHCTYMGYYIGECLNYAPHPVRFLSAHKAPHKHTYIIILYIFLLRVFTCWNRWWDERNSTGATRNLIWSGVFTISLNEHNYCGWINNLEITNLSLYIALLQRTYYVFGEN